MTGRDVWLDDMRFVQRRDHQQLEIQLLEQIHRIGGILLIRFTKCLIHDDKAERARLILILREAILIGNRRSQDRIHERSQ